LFEFEDVDFQNFLGANFEAAWNEGANLSDEEKTLFPNTETMNTVEPISYHFSFDDQNPLLSSAAMEDNVITTTTTELPSDDIFDLIDVDAGNSRLDFSLESLEPEESIDLEPELEKSCPSQQKANIEEVMSIHSYSQPQIKKEPAENPENHTVQKPLRKVQAGRVNKRQRKPVRHFDESSDESSEAEYRPVRKRNKSNSSSKSFITTNCNRKVKMYEMDPFEDPEMEKCRQNAINAKMNRDKKKTEKNSMQKEMSKLRRENEDLKKKNRRYREKLTSFEARLQIMESIIQSNRLDGLLKASGNESATLSTSGSDDHEVIYY